MTQPVRKAILLGATALALVAAPMLLNQTGLGDISAYAKDGNGNGGGNSDGGGGSDNGGGNSDHGNSGGGSESSSNGGNGHGNGGGGGGKEKKVATTEEVSTTTKADKTKNLKAQLAGLNSLNRNINGLMNSSDKRMELIREFVQAGADLVAAQADLETAQGLLGELEGALNTYLDTATAGIVAYDGSTVYDAPTLQGLTDRLGALNQLIEAGTATPEAIAEQALLDAALTEIDASAELAAVNTQQGVVDGLVDDVAALEEATSPEALQAALLAAANKNRVAAAGGAAYLTPEVMAWAEGQIAALTEAYVAQQ